MKETETLGKGKLRGMVRWRELLDKHWTYSDHKVQKVLGTYLNDGVIFIRLNL